MEVIFRPRVVKDKIACEIIFATAVCRPQHLMGKTLSEIMADTKVNDAMTAMDKCVSPLLKDVYYFEGRTYSESGLWAHTSRISLKKWDCVLIKAGCQAMYPPRILLN